MRVTLVQPPSNRFDTSELAPPLGPLSVAAVLVDDDVDVVVLDLNLLGLRDHAFVDHDFHAKATRLIADTAPDVVGFTSMALESHVCLELARRLKALDPAVTIVLGGPHFSAIAGEALRLYPWVDHVITGEGEIAARTLLRHLRGRGPVSAFENIAHRRGGEVRLARVLKPNTTLDDLPFPAYHLVDLEPYFALNPFRVLHYEHARGCMLRCAFCYSPGHWGQGEQTKRIDRVLADLERHHAHGARRVFFVSDNFVNSRPFAQRLCDALAGGNPGLTWSCYGTLAQLGEETVSRMAAAGCNTVFVGVDAVSASSKRRFQKHYFRGWEKLRSSLEVCIGHGVKPTCAFLFAPDGYGAGDGPSTMTTAVRTYNLGCDVRLNPLTIYPGTQLARDLPDAPCRYSESKARYLYDGFELIHDNPYARARPSLFPFHCTVGEPARYERFVRCMHTAMTLLERFPRTLLQWSHHEGDSPWSAVAQVAARQDLGSLPDRPVLGAAEVTAFSAVVREPGRSPGVRDTHALESAEHRLRATGARPVRVAVDSTTLEFELQGHVLLDLGVAPAAPAGGEPPAPSPRPARPCLVVRRGGTTSFLGQHDVNIDLVRRLGSAAASGEAVGGSRQEVAALIAANVLQLAPRQRQHRG